MEAVLIASMTGAIVLLAALSLAVDRPVDWGGVMGAQGPRVALMGAGVLARARATMPRVALFAIGAGSFSNFGVLTSLVLTMPFSIGKGRSTPD